ncbi:hypothetical protein CK203_082000 [Vitis vinifera]|uniref:CCR4-NOT transcription complex subunit 1-like NOT1 connector domain-containing protein n=1 Tax=Vitis vinifera TaxID=29760 RepID=A0A438BW95_VITVI|nr:hypothetical protein CK203_082000 [Vitis vinifera]
MEDIFKNKGMEKLRFGGHMVCGTGVYYPRVIINPGLVAEVPEIIHRCASRDEAALAVAQKVFKGLYADASNSSNVAAYLAILVAIRDLCKLVVKELTSWVCSVVLFLFSRIGVVVGKALCSL